jgi:hypothetical protein
MERAQTIGRQVVVQPLDPRLVLHGRESVRSAGPRFGRIDAALAVHLIGQAGDRPPWWTISPKSFWRSRNNAAP